MFKRVVEYGDGWMPGRVSVEELKSGRAALNELAERAGRDPRSIEVFAFGQSGDYRDREAIEELEEAGVNRVNIWLDHTEGDEALVELEKVARQVL